MLADIRLHVLKGLSLCKLRQLLFFGAFFFLYGLKGTLESILKIFPAVMRDRFTGSMKSMTAAGKLCLYRFIQMFFPRSTQ